MQSPLIEIRNLSKEYKIGDNETLKALDDVSVTIEHGEYVSIIGPSGSGKSTLLQIMGLLDQPTRGSYKFMGQETTTLKDDDLTAFRSQNIGFIFQLFNLLPRVSVEENTILPVIYRGVPVDKEYTMRVLTKLGLDKHHLHTPSQLSGGQQQRVAIARALINRPKIIFADEPTGNLPQKQAHEIISELEDLHKEGLTLFIITHDPLIADRAQRVIRIVDGKIVSDEKKSSWKTHYTEEKEKSPSKTAFWNPKLFLETMKIALQSMVRNKFRTFLTMLGIIIGVSLVMLIVAIGEGAKKNMEYSLRQMGSNMFRVAASLPSAKGGGPAKRVKRSPLSWTDYDALMNLKNRSENIEHIAPSVIGTVSITYAGKSWSTNLEGVTSIYEKMRNNTPIAGRFFTDSENENQDTVCIIGQTVYQNLFEKNANPIGQLIKINSRTFRVIGLLPSKGSSWEGDQDDTLIMPINTAMKKLLGAKYLTFIFIQAKNENSMDAAIGEVSNIIRQQHLIRGDDENDFKVKNFGELKEKIEDITSIMTKFILIVALISLVVGGVGIMNIMLVSVTERTREIGVRKAIGARSRDILLQFLIESSMISVVGGLIGILSAFLIGAIIAYVTDWEILFKMNFIAISFLFSLFVGVFFGLYPARKASKLSPIHALRYE